jgi:hypothetical protein
MDMAATARERLVSIRLDRAREAVQSLLDGHGTLMVQPTGSGKIPETQIDFVAF